jgi:glycosyltransferase involved in cell wall biosynthesis
VRIIIATTQVPFIYGGAEMHAEDLCKALRAEGHEAEIVAIPFKWYPAERILDHMLACRLLDLTESNGNSIDLLIGLRFPAYLTPHPNKVLWILHQYRDAYELWDHPLGDLINQPCGAQIRDAIRAADRSLIPEAKQVFTNSGNVTKRLKLFCGIDSTPLYHPPPSADKFFCAQGQDYLFFPGRLCLPKRQELVLRALAKTRQPVRIRFAGTADNPTYGQQLEALANKLNIQRRVDWLGRISEEDKRYHYACALGVIYPPLDEDYGYVTLEAMLAAKPIVTCDDSGGVLEFVWHEETGLITESTPESLAMAMDKLWEQRNRAREWGEAGHALYSNLNISWKNVAERLLS